MRWLRGDVWVAFGVVLAAWGCGQDSNTKPASVRPIEPVVTVARPKPIVALPPTEEILEQVPAGPEVTAAVAAATHGLDLSRRRAMPERWSCSDAERKALAKDANHKRLKRNSDRLAEERWEGSALLRARVGQDTKYWQRIRWAYMLRGICDPEAFVTDAIVETTFLDQNLRVSVQVAPMLRGIERRLAASQGGLPEFEWLGAFAARTVRGPFKASKRLSNHAFGLAIDFEPVSNPYLSKRELAVIEEISGVKIKRQSSISAADRWDNFKEAETAFLKKVGPWLTKIDRQIAAAGRSRGRVKRLKKQKKRVTGSRNLKRAMERGGFLGVPRHFAILMEDAGLTWCTDFGPGADLMHFELRRGPARRR